MMKDRQLYQMHQHQASDLIQRHVYEFDVYGDPQHDPTENLVYNLDSECPSGFSDGGISQELTKDARDG
jgi:hypothetical protein